MRVKKSPFRTRSQQQYTCRSGAPRLARGRLTMQNGKDITRGRINGAAAARDTNSELLPLARPPTPRGEWRKLIVSVPGRCGTFHMAPRAVFPILHCESSSGQPRGARTACVLLLAAGAEWAFFNSQPSILYKDTLGGATRRMCDTSGWSWRWPSVVSQATRSADALIPAPSFLV